MESGLARTLAAELRTPVVDEVSALADEIRRRHGAGVAAVLFYGSCLRRATLEGVLDFYVLVDACRKAYPQWRRRRRLVLLGALLAPNVHFLEKRIVLLHIVSVQDV